MALLGLLDGAISAVAAATVTASVTPTGVVVLGVYAAHGTVDFTDTTTVSGCGLTWVKVGTVLTSGDHTIETVFVGYGTPTAGAITVTLSQTASTGRFSVLDTWGPSASDPSSGAVTNSGTGTSGSVTVGVTSGKFQVVFFSHKASEATAPDATAGTSWRETSDTNTSAMALESQLGAGTPAAAASWVTSSRWEAIVFEMTVHALLTTTIDEDVLGDGDPPSGEASDTQATMLGADDSDEGPNVPGYPSGVWAVISG